MTENDRYIQLLAMGGYYDGKYVGGSDPASSGTALYSWANNNLPSDFPYRSVALSNIATNTGRNADYFPSQATTEDIIYQNSQGGPFWKDEGNSNMGGYLPDSASRAARQNKSTSIDYGTYSGAPNNAQILQAGMDASKPGIVNRLLAGIGLTVGNVLLLVIGILLLGFGLYSVVVPSADFGDLKDVAKLAAA